MKKFYYIILLTALFIACSKTSEKLEINQMNDTKYKVSQVKVINTIDPICGMDITDNVADTLTYQGNTYGFCSSGCKENFQENPQSFLK